ncbi:hypothetical protein METBIDRAFT_75905 [Metschnikowia bicuspidata var. bicuspidata NRRL YB-4993]|uniref:Phospholipid/glycerol acyltransferase domain-containing protein n=1 Tax=Metschnikowia bicuspidata var. bicuspidata NRRL YB-4993 TaxID=869754 RepID=A0A1A0HFE8_9ASCO|nr:hypothetical protein METBIDRAFT_75905 [Metschnikowia bicuspidata var. bicuspidata NRRL YB-4993]OBA22710.1 hypothetical protein METBIDRAFT_75905 [Metschnikowia bicuspidata var. bicuspidata NRRL YB-4993]
MARQTAWGSSCLPPDPSSPNADQPLPKADTEAPNAPYKPFRQYQLWLYDFVGWMFSVIFDCFFREIRPRGAFRIPKSGPVIFVAAPHANQFVDPLILSNQVRKEANRRISFLIAAKSYHHPVIGPLSSAQLSIPVARAQDMLAPGTGKISIDFDADPLLVTGRGTRFTLECMLRGLLALPKSLGASEIETIVSDTELVLRREFKRSDAVVELLRRGTLFKVADKIDQKQVYHYVFEHLSRGECLGIFPEGGSHDRTELLPLKAGVAVMALGAMSHDPTCKVKIVPCGMNYFHAHKFRSRAVVEFGQPIEIDSSLVARYNDPETSRDSVKELLDLVTNGLKAVTVNCVDYETLMVVQAARRLYAGNFAQYLPIPMAVEMNRRLVLGYETFKHLPEMDTIKKNILRYNKALSHSNLADHHVEDCDENHKLSLIPVFIVRALKVILLLILALPGSILFSPVFAIAKYVSVQKKRTALANSSVKVKANDVVATWKILISMGVAPLLYSFYASVGTWYCKKHNYLSSYGLLSMWFILYILGIVVTYSALVIGEQGMDLFKSLRPLYLSIFLGSTITEVKQMRRDLSNEITEFVNKYGLELFPDDFNLLEVKSTKLARPVDYDSDEEEELKTQELRNRRLASRKAKKASKGASAKATGSSTRQNDDENTDGNSSTTSDGISLPSDLSYTNIPMFSDYSLYMNAKKGQVDIDSMTPSAMPSTVSMADDFNFKNTNPNTLSSETALSEDSSPVELNFNSKIDRNRLAEFSADKSASTLSSKIQSRIREGRENAQ